MSGLGTPPSDDRARIVLHVEDVARATAFYVRHLQAQVVAAEDDLSVLDVVTATIELRLLSGGGASSWREDDHRRGFRHVGFKVADLDAIVDDLDRVDVPFRSRPQDLEAVGIRIAFFFDPDGTVIELVENHLRYDLVHDPEAVMSERELPVPERPRFDHVGHTVADLGSAIERYGPSGFTDLGSLLFPEVGMRIDFLRRRHTILELFSFDAPTIPVGPRDDTYGFAALDLGLVIPGVREVGRLSDGRIVVADPDDLPLIARSESA